MVGVRAWPGRGRARWPAGPDRGPAPCRGGRPVLPRAPRWGSTGRSSDPVRAQPPGQDHRQVGQHERQPGARRSRSPSRSRSSGSPGRQCPAAIRRVTTSRSWRGGDRGGVVVRVRAGPRPAPRSSCCARTGQRGHDRVGPARDHLRVAFGPAVDMTEQPLRAGLGVRTQPRRDVHAQHDPARRPAAAAARPGRAAAGRTRSDPALNPSYRRTVPTPVFRLQRQLRQRPHRPVAHTTPHRPARTAHPPGRSNSRRTPQRNRARSPGLSPGRHPWSPVGSCGTLGIAATVFVFELCERNPKRIKRWPYLVSPTRRPSWTSPISPAGRG